VIVSLEAEELGELLAAIYDAAVDRDAWAEALRQLTAHLGAHGTSVVFEHFRPRNGSFAHDHGMADEFRQSYATHYAALNPLSVIGLTFEAEDIFSIGDLMPPEQFRETPFYREWMAPQGFADAICVYLERTIDSYALLLVRAQKGEPEEIARIRSRLRLVVPHLRRAARIGRLLEASGNALGAMDATLSTLSAGVFLVGVDAQLAYRNAAADRLLASEGPVRLNGGRLTTGEPHMARVLADAIATSARLDGTGSSASIDLASDGDGCWRVTIIPLVPYGARARLEAFGATAAVFIAPAEAALEAGIPSIAAQYGLTKAEARALNALIGHEDIASASRALGVSTATLKSHIAAIYAKTGLSRQVDIIKLLAGRGGLTSLAIMP
jgi:DNA-binding CsgD family transcriptional regulator